MGYGITFDKFFQLIIDVTILVTEGRNEMLKKKLNGLTIINIKTRKYIYILCFKS